MLRLPRNYALLAVVLTAHAGCVTDVYLGPEPRQQLADAAQTIADSAAEPEVRSDAGEPDAGLDAALLDSRVPDDGGGPEPDAADGARPAIFCGMASCTPGPFLVSCPVDSPFICWPSSGGTCEPTCGQAPRCGREQDPPCPADAPFCNLGLRGDVCNGTRNGGYCQARPERCEGPEEPVCGCDGARYESECAAALRGIPTSESRDCLR